MRFPTVASPCFGLLTSANPATNAQGARFARLPSVTRASASLISLSLVSSSPRAPSPGCAAREPSVQQSSSSLSLSLCFTAPLRSTDLRKMAKADRACAAASWNSARSRLSSRAWAASMASLAPSRSLAISAAAASPMAVLALVSCCCSVCSSLATLASLVASHSACTLASCARRSSRFLSARLASSAEARSSYSSLSSLFARSSSSLSRRSASSRRLAKSASRLARKLASFLVRAASASASRWFMRDWPSAFRSSRSASRA
mmetsp:Transcript_12364/g.39568  ORF Transcript_12364/g.39568 Transcript_12364/m.39568 type:complete len:262 (-) Transcript_12364:935-1720(-)